MTGKVCSNPECHAGGAPQPLDAFHRHPTCRGGLYARCKACEAEAARKRRANWTPEEREAKREAERRWKIRRKYDIELEEYDAILARGCAICGSHERLHLDHDHATDAVRDALCGRHNLGLGHLQDDPEQARSALHYLSVHGRSKVERQ